MLVSQCFCGSLWSRVTSTSAFTALWVRHCFVIRSCSNTLASLFTTYQYSSTFKSPNGLLALHCQMSYGEYGQLGSSPVRRTTTEVLLIFHSWLCGTPYCRTAGSSVVLHISMLCSDQGPANVFCRWSL